MLTDEEITTEITKLATGGVPAIGLVSDGTTRLLLRFTASTQYIRKLREDRRREKIAMCQADVVGHSMGGLLGRRWAGDPVSRVAANYKEGDCLRTRFTALMPISRIVDQSVTE